MMPPTNNYCIVTTINLPTKAIEVLYEKFGKNLIVVGDKKTPKDWGYKDVFFMPCRPEEKEWFEGYDPFNHYARKNIGYLEAIKRGAELIYDSDDDNIPNIYWEVREQKCFANDSVGMGWFNVYSLFSSNFIWPRGFSLSNLKKYPSIGSQRINASSIQQGLSDGEPDVDAIWRLVANRKNIFNEKVSIYLKPNTWCPFNSQSTWWFPKAFPLMYLPVYSSFRMTDIWRSFVAQKCLWALGEGVAFHSPSEVYQDRNEHDLMKDFADEVPGYLNNDKIVEILSGLTLKQGEENVCSNMLTCYQALVDKNILPENEIRSLKLWIRDYEAIKRDLAGII